MPAMFRGEDLNSFLQVSLRGECRRRESFEAGGGAKHHCHGLGDSVLQRKLNTLVSRWLAEVPYGHPVYSRLEAFNRLYGEGSSFESHSGARAYTTAAHRLINALLGGAAVGYTANSVVGDNTSRKGNMANLAGASASVSNMPKKKRSRARKKGPSSSVATAIHGEETVEPVASDVDTTMKASGGSSTFGAGASSSSDGAGAAGSEVSGQALSAGIPPKINSAPINVLGSPNKISVVVEEPSPSREAVKTFDGQEKSPLTASAPLAVVRPWAEGPVQSARRSDVPDEPAGGANARVGGVGPHSNGRERRQTPRLAPPSAAADAGGCAGGRGKFMTMPTAPAAPCAVSATVEALEGADENGDGKGVVGAAGLQETIATDHGSRAWAGNGGGGGWPGVDDSGEEGGPRKSGRRVGLYCWRWRWRWR